MLPFTSTSSQNVITSVFYSIRHWHENVLIGIWILEFWVMVTLSAVWHSWHQADIYPLIFNWFLGLIQDSLHIFDTHDLSQTRKGGTFQRRNVLFGWKVFSSHSSGLVSFQGRICNLYPRMWCRNSTVVKALLFNPIIFKECAPAMLNQTTRVRHCSVRCQRITLNKECLSVETFTLLKYRSHISRLRGYYYHMGLKSIFLHSKDRIENNENTSTSCIVFRQWLPTLSPSMTSISICMNSMSWTCWEIWACKTYKIQEYRHAVWRKENNSFNIA